MTVKLYAVIERSDNRVVNTIVANDDFLMDEYILVEILEGVSCEIGMIYNDDLGAFNAP